GELPARIGRPHEGLAGEEAADSGLAHAGDVGRSEDAALRDDQPIGGNFPEQSEGGGQGNLEGPQVAVVDADQGCREPQGAIELVAIVDLDEDIEADLDGTG